MGMEISLGMMEMALEECVWVFLASCFMIPREKARFLYGLRYGQA